MVLGERRSEIGAWEIVPSSAHHMSRAHKVSGYFSSILRESCTDVWSLLGAQHLP